MGHGALAPPNDSLTPDESMDALHSLLWSNFKSCLLPARTMLLISLVTAPWLAMNSVAVGQVRTKRPDRGVYRSPLLTEDEVANSKLSRREPQNNFEDLTVVEAPRSSGDRHVRRDLVEVALEEQTIGSVQQTSAELPPQTARSRNHPPALQPVTHQDVVLVRPGSPRQESAEAIAERWIEPPVLLQPQGLLAHDATCDGCDSCGGCDTMSCDSMCCDGSDCGCGSWLQDALCLGSDRWFGGAELLMMWRKGDRLPPLVTTGPDTDPDTAGELGQPDTVILAGNGRVLKDLTAGGRFTLGYWLDSRQCQGLVGRFWFAGQESTSYGANQDQVPVIARPFLNVSDNQAAAQDTQLVAFPARSTGAISVRGTSEVYGADLSVRQYMYGKFGGTIDLVYGYQYMRLNEGLTISSTSTSLIDDVPPLGAVLS
ncbi:MAG: BBP7 family outer membrane beta-barrel protein, partial [Rubripirellula sp.]